ncbi:SusC/RagA family TonB-linked outer membrane protein [Pedobacter alluvionis]|uniref:SusC/RagA family TonB-linked outer membrane protein n=1 Tax=Pedobacter alluvionis TaxID=475253 RepID=A0A497XXJ0_9SPHI|nr:SusC/RagA family TonB-linked outer membrane protein [Pedobacter alluvionis]RLJ73629.1 TonB-linked SusC/RagA family outer membrane protein [Pedobacter alluvionis]TFB32746.1 SusC/RagA family TonB-linked outer membrane protein [Pedobacter alluvionis]
MKKLLQSLFILLFLASTAIAQDRTITGTVTSQDDKLPIPGVTVKVKGASAGTVTDSNGKYSVSVPSGSNILEFSYIGYVTKEQVISANAVINITLSADAKTLTDVVVVGYGTTTKQAFTGSAKTISADQLGNKRASNLSQALAGEVSGVRVITQSGQPGTEAKVRIRGIGSVSGNRDPLYVVDGVPFYGSLNSVNINDIESTTVLKDAAATAIYGSRGSNGVILITTRSGRGKSAFIEGDVNFGTNMALLPRYDVIKSPEEFIGLAWEGLYNQGRGLATPLTDAAAITYANARIFGPTGGGLPAASNIWNSTGANLIDPATRQVRSGITRKFDPENWEDYAFQNSSRTEANVRIGGSSDKTSYFTSLGYLDDIGYSIKSNYKRLNARLNLTHEVKPWLVGGMNLGYTNSKRNFGGQTSDSGSIFWFVDNIPPIYPLFLRDTKGAIVQDPIFGGNQYDYGNAGRRFGSLTNAIADTQYNTDRDDRNELNGNVSLTAKIIPGLTFENTFGLQYYNNESVSRTNKYYGSAASQGGSIYLENTSLMSYNLLNLVRYKKTFGENSLEALAAHEVTDWKLKTLQASRYNLVLNDSEDLNNGTVTNPSNSYSEQYKLESYFGQINYDYQKKYFLSGSLRRDGSSRFKTNRWGTFGSVGAAWLVSSEEFMKSQNIFSSLKLKASYGLIGDQGGVGYYPGYNTFNIDNVNDQPGLSIDLVGNPDLTWETSKMFQTGIEFNLGTYLTGSVDYYLKNTDDLIFDRRIGPSSGYAIVKVNGGSLRNQGLEFDLTGHIFKKKDFYLDLGINGEIFSNKMTAMPIDPSTGLQKPIDVQGNYAWSVGHSIYDFYVRKYTGVDAADGRSTWEAYYLDANNNGVPDGGLLENQAGEYIGSLGSYLAANPGKEAQLKKTTTKTYQNATQQYDGRSAIPDVRGAINLTTGYKGFDLSVQMLYSLGGYVYDGAYAGLMGNGLIANNNWHKDILNRWQSPSQPGDGIVPRISNNQDANVSSASSRFITKADYFSLNNVRLGYTFPTKITGKLGLTGLSVWVSGDNLYLGTSRAGLNPMTAEPANSTETGGSNTYRYSPLSTISAGLRVKL